MAVAVFGAALRDAGLPVGPDRCERFARAVTLMRPSSPAELRACGLATLVSAPDQIEVFDRVFAALFGGAGGVDGMAGPARQGTPGDDPGRESASEAPSAQRTTPLVLDSPAGSQSGEPGPEETAPWHAIASADERLGTRDFADLSAEELGELEALMRKLALATPLRRTRRHHRASGGSRADLRATLRQARRTGGEPMMLAHTAARLRPRRLVVLCDISGSMEPYARAMLQLLYCAIQGGTGRAGRPAGPGAARGGTAGSGPPRRPGSGGAGNEGFGSAARTEVFTFATRLTRITGELAAAPPGAVLARAGKAAPDWSGGTRIGDALKEFNDVYGCRGMARGAVVLIISDGWETGDPARVGTEMARLSRVAYRIVWANPRTKSPRYSPEVGGMAAAWPYCDAVVSAHSLNALDDLIAALGTRA
jgi:uncharacterized protein with von Willebrand factor type A (vWA) domain